MDEPPMVQEGVMALLALLIGTSIGIFLASWVNRLFNLGISLTELTICGFLYIAIMAMNLATNSKTE